MYIRRQAPSIHSVSDLTDECHIHSFLQLFSEYLVHAEHSSEALKKNQEENGPFPALAEHSLAGVTECWKLQ